MGIERLVAKQCVCFVVYSYRTHRTKRGHYVWRRCRVVQEALSAEGFAQSPYGYLAKQSMLSNQCHHNKKLTADEVIQFIAEEGK